MSEQDDKRIDGLSKDYQPTKEELKGNEYGYCYMQQDVWQSPEEAPFMVKPEST